MKHLRQIFLLCLLWMIGMATHAEEIPNNEIWYTSSEKLNETTDKYYDGLHTNAFNATITSHEFSNGKGIITFDADVTSIGERAFSFCSSLKSIEIPNSVTSIGESAFSGCSSLTSVYVSWDEPLDLSSNPFNNYILPNCTLYVPAGTTSKYAVANVWKDFGTIVVAEDAMRTPFKEIYIPGVIEAEDFDKGGEGFTFRASDSENSGVTTYRTDGEGIDILKITGGYAIGNTKQNNWQEYTVNVSEEGKYCYEIIYASSSTAKFLLQLHDDGKLTSLGTITAAGTGGTSTYKSKEGQLYKSLAPGKHIIRISYITNGINFDKIVFPCTTVKETSNNQICYEASEKLNETTGNYYAGLHTNAFNATITSHEFSNGKGIITFDANVTSIGDGAFYYCFGLTSIEIPNSVTSIGNYAFSKCNYEV